MVRIENKYQSQFGEIRNSYAYEKFHFKSQAKGIALKYVEEGCEYYRINQQIINVLPGQFIIVQEGQEYEAYAKLKSQKISGLCIDLNPSALDIDLAKIYNNPLLLNLPFDCFYFSQLGNKLNKLFSNTFSKDENEQKLKLNALKDSLNTFAEEIHKLHLRLSFQSEKINTQRAILVKMLSAKNFIYKNYQQKVKLDQLAKYAGISKFHFIRLFKLCFQQSPLQLQESLRMNKANELINIKTKNLSTIAFDLGYGDLASFSKKFKKHFNVSPSCYRKLTK